MNQQDGAMRGCMHLLDSRGVVTLQKAVCAGHGPVIVESYKNSIHVSMLGMNIKWDYSNQLYGLLWSRFVASIHRLYSFRCLTNSLLDTTL